MSSISGLQSSVSGTTTRKGISGLASGLDTDELVKQMTSGTLSKINKKLQQKQMYQWQSDAIRSISSKLVAFSQKYTSFASSTNLSDENFFARTLVKSLGKNADAVSVSGVSDAVDNLSILGVKQLAESASLTGAKLSGSSNDFSTGDIDLNGNVDESQLADKFIQVKYGTKVYNLSFSNDTPLKTVDDVTAAINKAMEGKTLPSGDALSEKVKVENNNGSLSFKFTGSDSNNFEISGGSKEALEILGFEKGDAIDSTTGELKGDTITQSDLVKQVPFKDMVAGKSMQFTFNGVTKTIKFPEADEMSTGDDLKKELQSQFDEAFGTGKITVDFTQSGSASKGSFSFKPANESDILKFAGADAGIGGANGAFKLESGASNRFNIYTRKVSELGNTSDFKINGKSLDDLEIKITSETTVSELINKINNSDAGVKISYLETTDKLSVKSTETGSAAQLKFEGALADKLFGTGFQNNVQAGKDAIVMVDLGDGNQTEISRSSNTFDVDGLKVTVKSKFGYDSSGNIDPASEAVTFEAKADSDKVVDAVKSMVEDFNKILEEVYDQLGTKPDNDYQPLTSEQKKDMSEDEIKAWEKEAKKGILFNDSDLSSLANDIRFIFSATGGVDLSSLGISTSTNYEENGKLSFDEAKLRTALEERPNDVMKAFTGAMESVTDSATGEAKTNQQSGGAITRLKNIFDKYAKTEGATKGILVERAGSQYSALSLLNNALGKRMDNIDSEVKNLKSMLKNEEDRYYRQFTRLEQVVQQMNSQSSWLSQQFGTN